MLKGTYGLQAFHRLGEVAHEGERADALTQPRDPPEAEHESIFVRQRLYFTALLLVIDQRLHLVVRRDEALKQLQEVQAQHLLVVPGEDIGSHRS